MAITSIVSNTRMIFNAALGMTQTPLDVPRGRVSLFIAVVGGAIMESKKGKKRERERRKEGGEGEGNERATSCQIHKGSHLSSR